MQLGKTVPISILLVRLLSDLDRIGLRHEATTLLYGAILSRRILRQLSLSLTTQISSQRLLRHFRVRRHFLLCKGTQVLFGALVVSR